MLGKLTSYIRQQHLGLLALFIALGGSAYAAATINSASVVDNSLTGADIKGQAAKGKKQKFTEGTLTGEDIRGSAASPGHKAVPGSIFGQDIGPNTLTGANIDESTLGTVPSATNATNAANATNASNADRLNGKDSSAFLAAGGTAANAAALGGRSPSDYGTGVESATESIGALSNCSQDSFNYHCADLTVKVPAGATYLAVVWSSFSAKAGANNMTFYYCPETYTDGAGFGCISPAVGASVIAGGLASGATTGMTTLTAGRHIFATQINPDNTVANDSHAAATTTVMLFSAPLVKPPYELCPNENCSTTGSSGSSGASGSSGGSSSGASGQSSSGASGSSGSSGSSGDQSSSGSTGGSSGASGISSGGASGGSSG